MSEVDETQYAVASTKQGQASFQVTSSTAMVFFTSKEKVEVDKARVASFETFCGDLRNRPMVLTDRSTELSFLEDKKFRISYIFIGSNRDFEIRRSLSSVYEEVRCDPGDLGDLGVDEGGGWESVRSVVTEVSGISADGRDRVAASHGYVLLAGLC
ncbi:unnamed protein product [Penicillium viridicatum]